MSSLLVGYAKKAKTGGDVLAKLVLVILADYANAEGKAWPSLKTLATETERSIASVKRARAKLIELGLITESQDQGYTLKFAADRRPKVYDILPKVTMPERPAITATADTTGHETNDGSQVSPRDASDDGSPMHPRDIDNDGSPMSPRDANDGSCVHPTTAHPCTERRLTHEPQTVIEDNKLSSKPSGGTRAHAREATPAENKNTLDTWTPDAHSIALADELDADVDAEAGKFRDRVSSSGRIPDDPDADFRAWLRAGAHRGMLTKRKTVRPSDHRYEAEPHRHSMTCEHVLAIMGPQEDLYSHEREGFAPSEWMRACQAQADILNRQEQTA